MIRTSSVTFARDERRRMPQGEDAEKNQQMHIQSTKRIYNRKMIHQRTPTGPPRKPQRTFAEKAFNSSEDISKLNRKWASVDSLSVDETIHCTNAQLTERLAAEFKNNNYWFDAGGNVLLFLNPYDDISGEHPLSFPLLRSLSQESSSHEHFNLILSGESYSGKSSVASSLLLHCCLFQSPREAHIVTNSAIMVLRALTTRKWNGSGYASMTNYKYHISRWKGRLTSVAITRGRLGIIDTEPIILNSLLKQSSAGELEIYRLKPLRRRLNKTIIESGPDLQQFRLALQTLSISSMDVERILAAMLLIRSVELAEDRVGKMYNCIEMVNNQVNARAIMDSSALLGVSAHHLVTVIQSSATMDRDISPAIAFTSLLLEALVDKIASIASNLLDFDREESPLDSAYSTDDSGIEIERKRHHMTTIEVVDEERGKGMSASLRKHLTVSMQSLFATSNCSSPFAIRLFESTPLSQEGICPMNYPYRAVQILCLKTNDACEYKRISKSYIKKQLDKYRQRADGPSPQPPKKDYK